MPYIPETRRENAVARPISPGELNYAISWLLIDYVERMGLAYPVLNDVIGAVEAAKLEFNRRVVAPYENRKIRENGDIYPVELTGGST